MKYALIIAQSDGGAAVQESPNVLAVGNTALSLAAQKLAHEDAASVLGATCLLEGDPIPLHFAIVRVETAASVGDTLTQSFDVWTVNP